jgi:arabinofuranosyltransferase
MPTSWRTTTIRIFPILLIGLALAARLIPGTRTIDDSYITYRYARNILAGDGFVFNPGERVMGTTTPLYTFLMTGLGALTGGTQAPFPSLALVVNALADAGTCLLLWYIGRRIQSPVAGAGAALVWAIAPYSVTFAIGGLETSVYVFLLTGMMAAHLSKRRNLAALAGVLALLTRPDAILLVGPVMVDRLWQAWKHKDRLQPGELAAFLLPGIAWAAFATAYFGSPVPHSVSAKLAVYRLEPGSALIRLLQHYATPFFENNTFGGAGIAVGLVLYPFLSLLGALKAWRIQPRLWPWLIYPWVYLLVFALPNPLIFRWYLTPPLPAYFLLILTGAEKIVRDLAARRPAPPEQVLHHRPGLVLALALIVLLPLASTLTEWQLRPDHGPKRPAPEMAWFKLELLYQQAAELIAPHMNEETLLAAGDVGALGYYTPARILDTVGLNSPVTLDYYPLDAEYYVTNYAIPAELFLSEQPDWIVVQEVYIRRTAMEDADFQGRYQLWDTLPNDIYGSEGMLIFRKTESGD